mmetsp:Transcript_17501/g.26810  ORF Transcript_17501/g.26810 Transcript_17501/m.26810 type:complete len:95 (+) Transcript_17501:39-323(+)
MANHNMSSLQMNRHLNKITSVSRYQRPSSGVSLTALLVQCTRHHFRFCTVDIMMEEGCFFLLPVENTLAALILKIMPTPIINTVQKKKGTFLTQ